MDLWSQLQNFPKGGLSTSEYILKGKTLSNHLAASRDPVLDRDLMIIMVSGLGYDSHYNAFVTGINMRELWPSLSALQSMLE